MNIEISEQILLPAVDEYNQAFGDSSRMRGARDAILSGRGGTLDSLELVNFIVIVERKLRAVAGKEIRLVTEEALAQQPSPFLTLENLEKYIADKLGTAQK